MRELLGSMSSRQSNHQRLLTYTKQLASHVNQGQHQQALTLFCQMRSSPDLKLDPFVFPLTLKSCSALRLPRAVCSVHSHAIKAGLLSNPFIASALVDSYGKSVSIDSARQLFDEIPERNAVVWNSMISLYSHSKDVSSAIHLFDLMDVPPVASTYNSIIAALMESDYDGSSSRAFEFYRRMQVSSVKPNLITVLALLPACVGLAALNLIREIHGFGMRSSIHLHPHLNSGLVEAYGRCGCLAYSSRIFNRMDERDVVAWSSMVSAYAFHGEAEAAMSTFRQMELERVHPDRIMFLGVLKACSHSGLADEALRFFELMTENYAMEAGSDHYACLVDVLGRAGRLYEAYELIEGMPVKATAKAWGALLSACRSYGEVGLAEIAGRVLFEIEPENAGNFVLLASIYAGAGKFEEALRVRKEMKEKGVRRTPGSSWFISQKS